MSTVRIVAEFAAARWGRRFRSRAAVERFQRRMLARHLRFLRSHSPLFRDAPRELAELPLMDKQRMMAEFDRLNTVGERLDDVVTRALSAERGEGPSVSVAGIAVGLSSGTSGHRGVFITSQAERDRWAGSVLAMTLPPGRLWGHRIALFLRAGNELYDTVRSRAIDFRFFNTHGDLGAHARELAEFAPTILVAPPSVLDVLAEHLARLPASVRPERVYSVAEVLTDADAVRLAEAFGQPHLHQLYQCTEGLLAHTCASGVVHLNEEIAIFEKEWLDDRRFVPIVTDFRRRSQPIVRYRMGDVLVTRESACPCGSPLLALERIEGREDDTLMVDGVPVFADVIARAMVRAEGFTQYLVRQLPDGLIEIALDSLDAAASVRESLAELWARLGVAAPTVAFVEYRHTPALKLRRVQRAIEGGSA